MDSKQRIIILLDKYASDLCSNEEKNELLEYLSSGTYDNLLDVHILQSLNSENSTAKGLDSTRSEAILDRILTSPAEYATPLPHKTHTPRIGILLAVAASILAIVIISSSLFIFNRHKSDLASTVVSLKEDFRRVENNSAKVMQIVLEDGSHVALQPQAVLIYPKHFGLEKREVVLEGEAYFDITKNVDKAFFIYHQKLVTRVLGTSFIIKGDKDQQEVEVITGKVEVYENVKGKENQKDNGVIITPNQKVIYTDDKHHFTIVLVDNPVPVLVKDASGEKVPVTTERFEFEKAPLGKIIDLMKLTYGIEIDLENDNINNCLFSGDISDQGLYAKLDVLCKATGLTYEIKGTRILINGKGCK